METPQPELYSEFISIFLKILVTARQGIVTSICRIKA